MGLRDEDPGAAGRCSAAARLRAATSPRSLPRSASRRPRFVFIAARGTSDNAALYAQYLFAIRNGLIGRACRAVDDHALRGAPRHAPTRWSSASRSLAAHPDIVAVSSMRRAAGRADRRADQRPGLAARCSGRPRARPARRTRARHGRDQDLHDRAARGGAAVDGARRRHRRRRGGRPGGACPSLMSAALAAERRARAIWPPATRRATHGVVLGRGFALRDRPRVVAQAAGDGATSLAHALLHGRLRARPLALAEPDFAVLAVAPSGRRARGPARRA